MSNTWVSLRGVGLLGILLLWGLGARAEAQSSGGPTASIAVQDVSLSRALERAATTAGISLVYDYALVEGRQASCTVRNASPAELLHCVLDGHPIDYVRTSKGTYVLQEALRRSPQRGQLVGRVRDGRRGHPLPNAHVRVTRARQSAVTVTDSTGRFRVEGLLPGPHSVVVTHLGYKHHEASIYVPPNETAHHEAVLVAAPVTADSIVIGADRYGIFSGGSGEGRVSTAQVRQPGPAGSPDVLEAASTLLGITTSAPYSDLHIQGGDTGGHTLRLDGVPIRNPASAGRLLGAFSPLALDGVRARKAGFGVLHGSALSGTIELEHDVSGQSSQYGTVRIDPRSLNARLQGTTVVGTTPVTAMVAGRVSVWDVYQEAALHDLIDRWSTLDPVLAAAQVPGDTSLTGGFLGARAQPNAGFYDLHGAARFKFSPSEHLYVSAYRGGSHLGADLVLGQSVGTALNTPTTSQTTSEEGAVGVPTHDEYAWANTAAHVRYETPVTSRTTGTLQASVSHYRGDTHSDVGPLRQAIPDGYKAKMVVAQQAANRQEGANEITEVGVEGRLDAAFSPRTGLSVTAAATYQGSRFRIGNAFAPQLRHRSETVRLATAAKTTVGLGAHTTFEGGVRLTALPTQARLFAEPRGAVRYDRSMEEFGTVALKVKGGLYRQFTTQFELSRDGATAVVPTTHVWLPVTSSMTPSRTYHLAGALTWHPERSRRWHVDLEGYRKWQPHLLAVDYSVLRSGATPLETSPPPAPFLGAGRGEAYGGGVHVEYDGPSFTGSLRYAYSRARRTFPGRFDGRLTPVPWTEPHRLVLDAKAFLWGGVALEMKGKGIWGRQWGYRRAYYAYLTPTDLGEAWDRIRLDRPGEHVLPPLYRLDAALSVTQSWGGVDVNGRIGIVNVLDRKNVADWGLQPQRNGAISRWARPLPGRRASVSIQVRY